MKVIQSCDSSSVIFPGAVDLAASSQGGCPRVRSSYLGLRFGLELWGKPINGGHPGTPAMPLVFVRGKSPVRNGG